MKAAVLGAGGMGGAVLRELVKNTTLKQVLVHDIDAKKVEAKAKAFDITGVHDLDAVLSDEDVKLVFITASNDAHKPLALAAMRAGKAVMCEKPMANNLADARDMVDYAEKHDAFLQIGFECRYSKLYLQVKHWQEQGLLGEIINTQGTYICSEFHGKGSWRNKLHTGGSMFGEKLSHYVDLPRWWIGDAVESVYTVCAPNVVPYYEVHDNYHTTYRFKNGAVSHLTFMMAPGHTFAGDPLQDMIEQQKEDGHALRYMIQGTKGAASTDVFHRRLKRWEFGDSPKRFTSTWIDDMTWPPEEDHLYFHNTTDQTHDIVQRVAEGLPPYTTARDAYETMKLCFAADLSADEGRVVRMDELEK